MSENVTQRGAGAATQAPMPAARKSSAARLIAAALVLGALSVWFSPYWAVAGLAQVAQAGNVQAVSEYLDLPRLRESLKGQLAMATQAELSKHKSKALEIVGAALGVLASDKIVETILTPEAITKFIAMKLQDIHGSRLSYAIALAGNNRAGWLTDGTFQIRTGNGSVMYWSRDGLSWHLDSMRVR